MKRLGQENEFLITAFIFWEVGTKCNILVFLTYDNHLFKLSVTGFAEEAGFCIFLLLWKCHFLLHANLNTPEKGI